MKEHIENAKLTALENLHDVVSAAWQDALHASVTVGREKAGRETSLAITKLEEALSWIERGITLLETSDNNVTL